MTPRLHRSYAQRLAWQLRRIALLPHLYQRWDGNWRVIRWLYEEETA